MKTTKEKVHEEATYYIYALPVLNRFVEEVKKIGEKSGVDVITSQNGCPYGMIGVYAESVDRQSMSIFKRSVDEITKPLIVW